MRLTKEQWQQIRTAHASGIGLREIARNMGLPAGTILSRAKREGWTRQVQEAKALVPVQSTLTATPMEAAAVTMRERGNRHVERMAGIVEKAMGLVESMEPGEVLELIDRIERLDKVGRRTYGLDSGDGQPMGLNILSQINIQLLNGE